MTGPATAPLATTATTATAAATAPRMNAAPATPAAPGIAADEATLWAACRQHRDEPSRQQLIGLHMGFARIMAARVYAGRPTNDVPFDDYHQIARLALIESVDRYDPDLGANFHTYAAARISGAILSALECQTERARQSALRRRIEQERMAALQEGSGLLEASAPTPFTVLVRVAVGLAIGFMLEGTGMFRGNDQSRDALGSDNAATSDHPGSLHESREKHRELLRLVPDLPERERMIVRMHYLQGIELGEIAQRMQLSKGRVSQLHNRALELLRRRITGTPPVSLKA